MAKVQICLLPAGYCCFGVQGGSFLHSNRPGDYNILLIFSYNKLLGTEATRFEFLIQFVLVLGHCVGVTYKIVHRRLSILVFSHLQFLKNSLFFPLKTKMKCLQGSKELNFTPTSSNLKHGAEH